MDNVPYPAQPPPPQSFSQQPPVQPPQPQEGKTWIRWVLLLILAIIISSGATYFLVQLQLTKQAPNQVAQTTPSPTPSVSPAPNGVEETANWKTYTNTKYNFFVKFPNSWTLSEEGDMVLFLPPGAEQFPATQKDTPGAGQPPPSIAIIIINKTFSEPDSQFFSSLKYTTMNVNGVDGIYYNVIRAPIALINFDLPTRDNKKTIRFSFPSTLENFSTFNPEDEPNVANFDETTFKTILSTFKFLK